MVGWDGTAVEIEGSKATAAGEKRDRHEDERCGEAEQEGKKTSTSASVHGFAPFLHGAPLGALYSPLRSSKRFILSTCFLSSAFFLHVSFIFPQWRAARLCLCAFPPSLLFSFPSLCTHGCQRRRRHAWWNKCWPPTLAGRGRTPHRRRSRREERGQSEGATMLKESGGARARSNR